MQAINSSNFLKHEVDINPSFDLENLRLQKKSRLNSLLSTLSIHGALLMVLFFFFTLTPPDPPLSDQGVFLNIGFAEEGMGDVQPMGNAEESLSISLMPPVAFVVNTGLPCEGNEIFHRSCQPPLESRNTSPCPGS